MALYHKWDVKNDFAYVLQFFSLISDSLGSVLNIELLAPYARFDSFLAVLDKNGVYGACCSAQTAHK